MDIAHLLKKLSQTPGLSGHEAGIRAVVLEEFGRLATETRVDKVGNAVALLRGSDRAAASLPAPRRSIMLATHMDEIGLMVAGVKHGFIHVVAVGGVDARILLGQEVIVHTQRGVHGRRALPGRDLPGVVASTPPNLLKAHDRSKIIPLDKLWIDVGLPDEKSLRKASGRAARVVVYAYGGRAVDLWWAKNRGTLERLPNFSAFDVPQESSRALAALAQRTMQLSCTVQDGHLWFGNATETVEVALTVLAQQQV